ncbi:GntR family transcriptional regulator [Microbacterium suwonense]|uniref:GntR family transcriptional regulator n=2 Tax=Microbacterium suwonense TaxID=683047 RepID=A0ABN6X434_9MICO|nr:GntR family transcriptional regulator [Microbacterium suwonense]
MLEQFGVGRGSLREALRILEIYGLINLKSGPGGGPVLLNVEPGDVSRSFSLYLHLRGATIQELADTRLILDPLAARMAAESITPESAALLRSTLEREAESIGQNQSVFFAANDVHYVLATMTGNRVFDLVATALKEMYTSRLAFTALGERVARPEVHNDHKLIGEAVLDGDADRAEELMRDHLISSLGKALESPGFAASTIGWA